MELEDLHAVQCDDPDEIAKIYADALESIANFEAMIDYLFHVRPGGESLH